MQQTLTGAEYKPIHKLVNSSPSALARRSGMGSGGATAQPVRQMSPAKRRVGVYRSYAEAQRLTGIYPSGIAKCAAREQYHAGGYLWRKITYEEYRKQKETFWIIELTGPLSGIYVRICGPVNIRKVREWADANIMSWGNIWTDAEVNFCDIKPEFIKYVRTQYAHGKKVHYEGGLWN